MDEENFNVSNQDVVENEEDERARTIPVYQKELTLEDREEAERIKAMPEYQELEQSCESYMDLSLVGLVLSQVQSDEIKKMPELLKKMPQNLRYLYCEQLHDFEHICEIEVRFSKVMLPVILIITICCAVQFVILHYLNSLNWSWWSKGISFIISFIMIWSIPKLLAFCRLTLCRSSKTLEWRFDDNMYLKDINYFSVFFGMMLPGFIIHLCIAFVSFMLPSWGDFSWLGWKTPIVLAVVIALFNVRKCLFMFNLLRKMGKRAAVYVKDFENFTSQYDEYRNFKKSAEGAKE